LEGPAGLELLDDLPWAEILFVRVGADEVEVELVSEGLGEEIAAAGERFEVEELVFDEAMNGFDVALESVSGGRNADVLTVAERSGKAGAMAAPIVAADELGAVVGLPDEIAQRDAAAIEVLLNAGGEDGTGSGGAALGEGPEQQSAAHVAGRVLDGGQSEGLGLRPVAGDIIEVLGVGGDLLQDAPGGLDVGQILFALIFALAFFEETVLAPDAFQGAMAEGKIELANEAACAEGVQLLTESDHLLFDIGGSFAGLMMRGAREFDQTARALPLKAAQPLAHGGNGGLEQPCRGFDAALAGTVDQAQAMIVGVTHFTHQDEVRGRHAGGIVRPDGQEQWVVEKWKSRQKKVRGIPTFPPPRRQLRLDYLLTPQTTLQFSTPLFTQTLQSRQGDTMWVGSTSTLSSLTPCFQPFILTYCSLRDFRLCAHFRGPLR